MSREFYALLATDAEAALKAVTARRVLHRAQAHPESVSDADFFDCGACGALERQEERAVRAVSGMRS